MRLSALSMSVVGSVRPGMRACTERARGTANRVIALVSLAVALAVPLTATGATPKPSWRCIAGICLGHSRIALDYQYGVRAPDIPSRTIRVPGGRVWACFWRCTNAVTEDGFTYYGGTQRPANRLLTVGTCSPIFRLPDGTIKGTTIPFGKRWNGYRRITLEGGQFGWEKAVRRGQSKMRVTLSVTQGRVQCVYLERAA